MSPTRVESDTMGSIEVPAEALYGASTARALLNFPISGYRFPRGFIRALGLIKKHAALTNGKLARLSHEHSQAIAQAAMEVVLGNWDDQFVVDVFQTGSGTSTHMNANEVIATRASQISGQKIHPNDQVNLGQSSNDVIPTAIHVAATEMMVKDLIPSLLHLEEALRVKTDEFRNILKIGRTHLQDATPMYLGQEFSGYATQVELGVERLRSTLPRICELALGGTAVGTGLNTHPEFARRTVEQLAQETALPFVVARNYFEAQSSRDACVEVSSQLKGVAVSLIKIANDIRWLGSGPRLGLGELELPATQPGSSIMPGKVNPVMSEMLMQVGAQVMGNDAAIAVAGTWGNFELNVMMPVMAHNLLESISLLGKGVQVFTDRCVVGLQANRVRCEQNVEQSLGLATGLVPAIGYEKAAAIAKEAHLTGKTVRQVAQEKAGLKQGQLEDLLDPRKQTGPR